MSTNAEIVTILARVDLSTVMTALMRKDTSQIRMAAGGIPTAEEVTLIMNASADDLKAAKSLMQRMIEAAESQAEASGRALVLFNEYAQHDGETAGEVVPRMTPEDRSEFIHCMEVAS